MRRQQAKECLVKNGRPQVCTHRHRCVSVCVHVDQTSLRPRPDVSAWGKVAAEHKLAHKAA